jgi:glycosyltransferase involved in cell wall biosynthesis
LAETLRSIKNQSAPPFEIFVVDDGSTDDTVAVARSFSGVTVISQPNGGIAVARNAGAKAACGDYVAFVDGDDLWAPDKLALQVAALESFGRAAFSFTDYRMFDERGFRKHRGQLRRHSAFRKIAGNATTGQIVIADDGKHPVLYDCSYIAPSSLMIRRADFLAVGGFDDTLRYCEDYEFCLRCFGAMPAIVLMEPLLFYRQHSGQNTSTMPTREMSGHFDVARRAAAAPERYPRGDVRYLARTDFLRHYRMAIMHARYGEFDAAIGRLESSLAARPTARARLALAAARLCRSAPGRRLFDLTRALWKRRPGRR